MSLAETVIKAANGDDDAIVAIIAKFEPIIRKCSRELNYEEVETDLIIGLLEIFPKMTRKISVETHEGEVVNYIAAMIRNKKIDLFRKHIKNCEKEVLNDELLNLSSYTINFSQKLEIQECLKKITERQKKVILLRYYHGFSDVEIAKILNVSRQAVNRMIRRAIAKIQEEYKILN